MNVSGQIANALRLAGIKPDAANRIASILCNHSAETQRSSRETVDLTPPGMRMIGPEARKQRLVNIDFRQGDPDYRPPQTQSSEDRPKPKPDVTVQAEIAPQEVVANYRVKGGRYTQAAGDGELVQVDLRVAGNGRGLMLDPPSNSLIGKTFRAEAGGTDSELVRFFVQETGQELIWKMQLMHIKKMDVVTGVEWVRNRGLVATTQTLSVWSDPSDEPSEIVVPTPENDFLTSITLQTADKAVCDVSSVATFDVQPKKLFEFNPAFVRLCKTVSAWSKGTSQSVLVYEDGSPLSETATETPALTAYNKFADVPADTFVLISRAGNGKYYRVETEMKEVVRGTFSAPWSKGASATVTNATNGSLSYSAKNYFGSITTTGTKACAIAWANGEWILLAAECT
jgi:hypothetical protein